MFPYSCPSCAQRLVAPSERAGESTVCPKCLDPVTIPIPTDPAQADQDTATMTPLPQGHLEFETETADIGLDLVAVGAAHEPVALSVSNEVQTPEPPRTARGPSTRRLVGDDVGRVILNPTGLFAVDIAAELSAAISMRMAPPPDPVSDRQLTLAGWLLGVTLAGTLWVVGVLSAPECFPFVALLGLALVSFGYLWRSYLAGRSGSPLNGLITLLPPIALVRLVVPTASHGLRPLRFVLAGAVILGLSVLGPAVRSVVEGHIGTRVEELSLDGSDKPAKRLHEAITANRTNDILAAIRALPARDSLSESDRDSVQRDLIALAESDKSDLQVAAIPALADWSPVAAKTAVRAGFKSSDPAARRAACQVADRVWGSEAAPWLAERLTERVERDEAKAALIRLGSDVEQAILPLLGSEREPVVLVACEVLEKVGGTKSKLALKELAEQTKSRVIRQEATQASEAIRERLK